MDIDYGEIVERVAMAICESAVGKCSCRNREPPCEKWIIAARAAIKAMREPTGKMLNAGINNGVDQGFGVGADDYTDVWQAMIDEALK